jgi:hypothetical protein
MSRWLVANRLPAILPPQPKHARGTQRYANYVVELWTVFVPADRCAGRVLCYERMLESLVISPHNARKRVRPLPASTILLRRMASRRQHAGSERRDGAGELTGPDRQHFTGDIARARGRRD